MISPYWTATFIIITITTVSGVTTTFLAVVGVLDQKRCLNLSPRKQIQVYMVLVNIILQCLLTSEGYRSLYLHNLKLSYESCTVQLFFLFFFITLNFWLTAWLCAFYCVTIVNFQNKVIAILKLRLPVVVPKLLLVTTLVLFIMSVAVVWNIHPVNQHNITQYTTDNNKEWCLIDDIRHVLIFFTGCFIPFAITLISIGFILVYLMTHVHRVKLSNSSLSAPQLQAHYRACRTMTLVLILFVCASLSAVVFFSSNLSTPNIFSFIFWVFILLIPTVQGAILIMGNINLKKNFVRIFRCNKE